MTEAGQILEALFFSRLPCKKEDKPSQWEVAKQDKSESDWGGWLEIHGRDGDKGSKGNGEEEEEEEEE